MRLKFSSHLKAAQFYGIALTIRSILLSVISAVKWNRRLALEADLCAIHVMTLDEVSKLVPNLEYLFSFNFQLKNAATKFFFLGHLHAVKVP